MASGQPLAYPTETKVNGIALAQVAVEQLGEGNRHIIGNSFRHGQYRWYSPVNQSLDQVLVMPGAGPLIGVGAATGIKHR
jgi:hypothetical protein